jgi:hypothetical protein
MDFYVFEGARPAVWQAAAAAAAAAAAQFYSGRMESLHQLRGRLASQNGLQKHTQPLLMGRVFSSWHIRT